MNIDKDNELLYGLINADFNSKKIKSVKSIYIMVTGL